MWIRAFCLKDYKQFCRLGKNSTRWKVHIALKRNAGIIFSDHCSLWRLLVRTFLLVSWKLTSLPLYAFFSLLVITRRAMICCLMKVSGRVMSTSTSGLLIWLVSPSFMISGKYLQGTEGEDRSGWGRRDLETGFCHAVSNSEPKPWENQGPVPGKKAEVKLRNKCSQMKIG